MHVVAVKQKLMIPYEEMFLCRNSHLIIMLYIERELKMLIFEGLSIIFTLALVIFFFSLPQI